MIGSVLRQLSPVVGFLIAVLVLAAGCQRDGLFDALGDRVAVAARGDAKRLLAGVVVLSSVATAVLSLDTTVVLVTPVMVAAAGRLKLSPAPAGFAAGQLANSASLLLPVSNLTNLLALAVVHISFVHFAALMALPWLWVIAVEYAGLRAMFRADLGQRSDFESVSARPIPRLASAVVVATLVGFVIASASGFAPVWPAVGGAVVLTFVQLTDGRVGLATVIRSAQLPFAVTVLVLGVVVRWISDAGLAHALRDITPSGHSWLDLLAIAGVSAVAANVLNNLPATLLLLPIVARLGVAPVLAVLIGVDVGPNLSYVGSLSNLLWRRVVGDASSARRWSLLGLTTVPVSIVGAVTLLWLVAGNRGEPGLLRWAGNRTILAAVATDEKQRLEALARYAILDTDAEPAFDDIARLATMVCGTPMAAVTIVTEDRQWFKASVGLDDSETPRQWSMCSHAIAQPEHTMVVQDASADQRFSDNPYVVGSPNIRFYAGVPFLSSSGEALGALCVIDRTPRSLSDEQRQALELLSRQVEALLEARRANIELSDEVDELRSRGREAP